MFGWNEIEYFRQIQDAFLPKTCPSCRDAQIVADQMTVGGVGGDFYDFPEVAGGLRGLIIGDVTGHGLRPALVMAMVFGLIRGAAPYADNPAERLLQINDLLTELNERLIGEWGVTMCSMFYGVLDVPRRWLVYANAGHPPPIACLGDRCELSQLAAISPPLGVDPAASFKTRAVDLRDVRRMLFYTDGLLDAFGGPRRGAERVSRLLAETGEEPVQAQLRALMNAARRAMCEETGYADDVSAFILDMRRVSKAGLDGAESARDSDI